MNKVILIGNLARDVEIRKIPSGKSVGSSAIATSKVFKNQQGEKVQQTQFHNFVIWGNAAETFAKYLKKGSKVMIEGELQHSDYVGQDGVKRYKTDVVVSNFEFLNTLPKQPAKPTEPKNDYAQPAPADDYAQPEPGEEEEIRIENIPF